jgi:hypothetical protein
MIEKTLRELCDASLTDIHQMARNPELNSAVYFYARLMSAFMANDLEKMQELVIEMDSELRNVSSPLKEDLKEVVHLRLKLRSKVLISADLEKACSRIFHDVLEAEKLFVVARGWELLRNETLSLTISMNASIAYKKFECPKKSLRSFYNSIVAESRLTPYKNFIPEYQTIIKMSLDLNDKSFAGMAMSMLSREYQIVGLHAQAMDFINEALELLIFERGSYHYYNTLLQKAHLLIEEKNYSQASLLLLECKLSSFSEITSARILLECTIDPNQHWSKVLEKDLMPTWKERLPELLIGSKQMPSQQEGPTSLEFRLLKLLWSGPIEKWDLIELLYPGDKDSYACENRFKNLVARLRKKFPEVLSFKDGQYYIQNKNQFEISNLIGKVR